MLRIAGNTFVFQQDSAPPYRAREIVQLLQQETPDFISPDLWLPNSPYPVDYRIWEQYRNVCKRHSSATPDTNDIFRRVVSSFRPAGDVPMSGRCLWRLQRARRCARRHAYIWRSCCIATTSFNTSLSQHTETVTLWISSSPGMTRPSVTYESAVSSLITHLFISVCA